MADPGGRFAFRFTADTSAAYLLSSRYGGIEYFSQPVATNPSRPDTGIVVIVADTSSLVPVVVRQRTTSAPLSGADGAIKVRVADIKRGKTTDVEIIGPNSVILATRKNAQVGDRLTFTHIGRTYAVEVLGFRNELVSGDSARLSVQLMK